MLPVGKSPSWPELAEQVSRAERAAGACRTYGTRWKYVSRGIQCELKEDVRRRLGRSPDRADACVMAWHVGLDRDPDRLYAGQLQQRANLLCGFYTRV